MFYKEKGLSFTNTKEIAETFEALFKEISTILFSFSQVIVRDKFNWNEANLDFIIQL